MIGVALTALALALLLVGEWREERTLRWIAKPLASAGFLVAALEFGALSSRYGRALLLALALSFLGDVLLLGRKKAAFLSGLVAFLAAHLAFLGAFAVRGIAPLSAALALIAMAVLGALVGRPLVARAEPALRAAASAYLIVISLMVAAAFGTRAPLVIAGAIAFYFSDLSVARDRFVGRSFANRAWGLPLYYLAQLIFAFTLRS
ncbi:MAG: lysoplasmalogenase family protein [Polyangia bacterium]